MHIGREEHNDPFILYDKAVDQVSQEKDLGVTFDTNFHTHISEKVKKANSMMAIIRRTFRYMGEKLFLPLYKAMVRSHLDFAASVYSPMLVRDVEAIESVQRRATRLIPGFSELSYPERLRKLKLPTLGYRRARSDMIELYKMLSSKYDPEACRFLELWSDRSERQSSRTKLLAARYMSPIAGLIPERTRLVLEPPRFGTLYQKLLLRLQELTPLSIA